MVILPKRPVPSSGRVLNPAIQVRKCRVQTPAARKDCVILENSQLIFEAIQKLLLTFERAGFETRHFGK